jgi:cytochrome c peroxidase
LIQVLAARCKLGFKLRVGISLVKASFPAAIVGIALVAAIAAAKAAAPTTVARYRMPETHFLSAMARLGAKMFFDSSLSASGRMSCASCHDPRNAYAPSNAFAVQLGGPDLKLPGVRAVPSLRYMTMTPPFSIGPESPFEAESQSLSVAGHGNAARPAGPLYGLSLKRANASIPGATAMVPQGGFFRDGRADTLQEQAIVPLVSPFEMDNVIPDIVYNKLYNASYARQFVQLFGQNIFADKKLVLSEAAFAVARYEIEEGSFHPFTSKYDYFLRGTVKLSASEARGLKLFDDPQKANCASCHLDKISADGQLPVFTDYQYEALGVPRNPAIPANTNPNYFDLGICGPLRSDAYAKQSTNCALFKTPTLRNVATRHVFFHNGVMRTLKDVVSFYVERDTNPELWYPNGHGGNISKFDDVPPRYRANIDIVDAPFNRKKGDTPALNRAEIDDVVAFLKTLTDGYRPVDRCGGRPCLVPPKL